MLIPQLRELAGDYGLDGAWVDGECWAAVPDYSPARAFTDHMAEPVTVPVDFLSGDYSPEDSVNSARLSGPYWVRQGKPWNLMAGSFATRPERRQKPAVQLQREAAAVVALGGPFAVTVRLAKAPTKVTLEPAGKVPPFQYRNGEIEIALPPIVIHEAIVVY